MIRYVPRYRLYVDTSVVFLDHQVRWDDCLPAEQFGRWSFVLESLDDLGNLEVADEEPGVWGNRLEVLAVVRGLEALEQPSRVTLVTDSVYLHDRLDRLIETPRRSEAELIQETSWQDRYWNADLWGRIDAALGYHYLETRRWRLDMGHHAVRPPRYHAYRHGRLRNDTQQDLAAA